jgi:hypothetical protein
MNVPGFNAEASAYKTKAAYYAGRAAAPSNPNIYPAATALCPPRCVDACEHGCRADGLSAGSCASLCAKECNAYTAGIILSCGPCVNNTQTCVTCGGGTTTVACGGIPCGGGSCPLDAQCCDGLCCGKSDVCCGDGHGCCAQGQTCESTFGIYYCVPNWLSFL